MDKLVLSFGHKYKVIIFHTQNCVYEKFKILNLGSPCLPSNQTVEIAHKLVLSFAHKYEMIIYHTQNCVHEKSKMPNVGSPCLPSNQIGEKVHTVAIFLLLKHFANVGNCANFGQQIVYVS